MHALTSEELLEVSGGCEPPPPREKGNNGWGNGAEGTNNGSDDGGTMGSKIDEFWNGPGDGPRPAKFFYR
jgi:hypothetical protein